MEKLYCTQCEEFQDDVRKDYYSSSYYSFNEESGNYDWRDSGDGEDGDEYYCEECGEVLQFEDFNPEPTNKWEGQDREGRQIETK